MFKLLRNQRGSVAAVCMAAWLIITGGILFGKKLAGKPTPPQPVQEEICVGADCIKNENVHGFTHLNN